MQGLRRRHEDLFFMKPTVEGAPGVGAFAILDGHGGPLVARAVAGHLAQALQELPRAVPFGPVPEATLWGAFARVDARPRERLPHYDRSGATAVTALAAQLANQRFR
eukprot:9149074-Alexandrium_andersonii.AAC.1